MANMKKIPIKWMLTSVLLTNADQYDIDQVTIATLLFIIALLPKAFVLHILHELFIDLHATFDLSKRDKLLTPINGISTFTKLFSARKTQKTISKSLKKSITF